MKGTVAVTDKKQQEKKQQQEKQQQEKQEQEKQKKEDSRKEARKDGQEQRQDPTVAPAAPASPVAPVQAGGGGTSRLAAVDASSEGPGTRHAVIGLVLAGVAAVAVAVRSARRGRGGDGLSGHVGPEAPGRPGTHLWRRPPAHGRGLGAAAARTVAVGPRGH